MPSAILMNVIFMSHSATYHSPKCQSDEYYSVECHFDD
jgi:hypothetical protein